MPVSAFPFKLGKQPAKQDARNFLFAALARKPLAAAVPASYDVDARFKGITIQMPMLGNDRLGDCVIASRGHETIRFETAEQGKLVVPTEKEVVDEYLKETGGPDTGLYILDSLNLWRQKGWKVKKKTYKLQSFAQVTGTATQQKTLTKQAIFLDLGVQLGIGLPETAQYQVESGKVWDVVSGPGDPAPWSWGGHCVYAVAYDSKGVTCVTWAKRQKMTWRFFAKYCDEVYGCIDERNAKVQKFIKLATLDRMLQEVA